MPVVSRSQRAEYLDQHHPILYKLCVSAEVPAILEFRLNTKLPFCYGQCGDGSPVPAVWDSATISVVPLWESGSGVIAIRANEGAVEFVQIPFEDANDVQVIATSLDGLLVYVFYFLVESMGGPEREGFADIQELASYLDFDKLELVNELIVKYSTTRDFDSFWKFTRSL